MVCAFDMRALRLVPIASAVLAACAASAPTYPSHAAPPASSAAAASASASEAGVSPPPEEVASSSPTVADAGPTSPRSGTSAEADASVVADAQVPGSASACNEQPPQDFLVRGNFRKTPNGNERAIQYRTDTYGYFKGFGHPGADAQPPSHYVVDTTFMGLPVKMHRKVVPALACVEAEIKQSCSGDHYTPHALAGIRFHNTYRGAEITNHIYGIAIDIDPAQNPCCGCVKPWSEAAICQRPAKTEYDRMALPECWVHAFEKYGFYWLGHDVLRDTMHFEFLGDPDRIVRSATTNR
jgi:hypothetical protein